MPSAVKITPRKIFKEDIHLSTENDPDTVEVYVGGVGDIELTPFTPILISDLEPYANDAAAASGGVGLGYFYFNTGTNLPKVRMT